MFFLSCESQSFRSLDVQPTSFSQPQSSPSFGDSVPPARSRRPAAAGRAPPRRPPCAACSARCGSAAGARCTKWALGGTSGGAALNVRAVGRVFRASSAGLKWWWGFVGSSERRSEPSRRCEVPGRPTDGAARCNASGGCSSSRAGRRRRRRRRRRRSCRHEDTLGPRCASGRCPSPGVNSRSTARGDHPRRAPVPAEHRGPLPGSRSCGTVAATAPALSTHGAAADCHERACYECRGAVAANVRAVSPDATSGG